MSSSLLVFKGRKWSVHERRAGSLTVNVERRSTYTKIPGIATFNIPTSHQIAGLEGAVMVVVFGMRLHRKVGISSETSLSA